MKTRDQILTERQRFAGKPRELTKLIRKEPLTVEEAFRVDSDQCVYNSLLLNNRLDELQWQDNLYVRGDFAWKDGVRDSEVVFNRNPNGRFYVTLLFEKDGESNRVLRRGNKVFPNNKLRFVAGTDPYDHDQTEYGMSMAAGGVLHKNDHSSPYFASHGKSFVCIYWGRPDLAYIFYEDMLMMCWYFGCPILFESQKPGIKKYFDTRGCADFLIHFPGYKEPGIPSTADNKQTLMEQTENHIENHINKTWFIPLIKQWLKFDPKNTEKYDLAMMAGWTLVADAEITLKREVGNTREITNILRHNKVPA
jgi:hypothetical protein